MLRTHVLGAAIVLAAMLAVGATLMPATVGDGLARAPDGKAGVDSRITALAPVGTAKAGTDIDQTLRQVEIAETTIKAGAL